MSRTIAALAALAALIATPALAADMAVKAPLAAPPAPSWTGFYVGIDGGWAWNQNTGDVRNTDPTGILFGPGTSLPTGAVEKPSGGLFGAEAGYNVQSGILVYGIETDIQWSDIHGSATVPDFPGPSTYSVSTKLDWFGTTRLRLGILPSNSWLVYITGGAIYGQMTLTDSNVLGALAFGPATTSTTRAGGTVGGGIEYAFSPNVSGKIEGLYYDMGTFTNVATSNFGSAFTSGGTFAARGAMVRGGLNWHFH